MTPVDIALANARVQAANAQLEAQANAAPTIETYGGAPFSIAPRVAERELLPARNLAQTVASGGMSYAPQLPDTGRSGIYYHPAGAQEAYQWGGIPMPIYQDDPYATATGRVVQTPWGLGWQALQGAVSRYPHVLNGVPNDAWSVVSQWMPQIPMWPQATWQPPQAMPRPAAAPTSRRQTAPSSPPARARVDNRGLKLAAPDDPFGGETTLPPNDPFMGIDLMPQPTPQLTFMPPVAGGPPQPYNPSLMPRRQDVNLMPPPSMEELQPPVSSAVPQAAQEPTSVPVQPSSTAPTQSRWLPPTTPERPWYAPMVDDLARTLSLRFPQLSYQPPE